MRRVRARTITRHPRAAIYDRLRVQPLRPLPLPGCTTDVNAVLATSTRAAA